MDIRSLENVNVAKNTAPLSLYFDLQKFSSEEIAEIIHLLSEAYCECGGDGLIINDIVTQRG